MGRLRAKPIHRAGLLAVGILWALQGQVNLAAVETVSETFVGMAAVVRGQSGARPQLTCLSLPVVAAVTAAGTVTGRGSATLTDTNAQWNPNPFTAVAGSFYVVFESGFMADVRGCDPTTRTLTLSASLPAGVTVGAAYRIRRHLTLADLLGSGNEAGLYPGGNPSEADIVTLIIGATQETRNFWHSNVPGYTGWYEDDYSPADEQVVYPEQALAFCRKRPGDVVFYVSGATRDHPMAVPVFPGYNLLGSLNSAAAVRLADLNLVSGDGQSGLAPGLAPSSGDGVLLFTSQGTTVTYFYYPGPAGAGWYDSSYNASDNVSVPPGGAFMIHRKAPNPLFFWNVPSE